MRYAVKTIRYPRIGIDSSGATIALKVPGNSRKSSDIRVEKALQPVDHRGYAGKMELFRRAAVASQAELARRSVVTERGGTLVGRSNAFEVWSVEQTPRQFATYDAGTLRAIYKQASAVRTAVDTIIREVTSIPWAIVPKEKDPANIKSITWARCLTTLDFFENPNSNPETFQQLQSKVLTDLLVLDAGAIEMVRGLLGRKLLELIARDGSTFIPIVDVHGILEGYIQYISRAGIDIRITFAPDELLYLMMYPQTNSVYGLPVLDSVINEVAALLYAMDYIANAFQESEIPPGILHLGNIGDDAYNRAKNEFRIQRGYKKAETKLKVIDNVDTVEWIDFKRPNREMQTAQLLHMIEKIVYRNFGVQPTEVGLVEGITKATAEVQERLSQIKLVRPLLNLLSTKYNREVIPGLGYKDVKFQFILRRTKDDRNEALAEKDRIFTGLRTLNETREIDGFLPVKGGDRPFILVGKRIYFVDELEKAVSEAWSQMGDEAIRGGHEDEGMESRQPNNKGDENADAE